jgi:AcrR family transcriptional regulator
MTEIVKERILDAARARFFAMGFTKVTLDELADGLGISKKTVYKYFPSKDYLLETVVERTLVAASGRVEQIVSSQIDYMDKFHQIWSFLGDLLSRFSKQFQNDLRRTRPELWRRMEEFRRENMLPNITHLFQEGARLGMLKKDVHTDVVVLMFVSTVEGIINPHVLTQHSFSAAEALQNILSVFFEGILSDEARALYKRKTFQKP